MSYIIEPQPRVSTPVRGQTPPPLRAPVTSPLTSPPTPPARVPVTPGIVRAPARPVRRHRIQRTRTAVVRKLFNGTFLNICNYMDDYFNMIKKSGILYINLFMYICLQKRFLERLNKHPCVRETEDPVVLPTSSTWQSSSYSAE